MREILNGKQLMMGTCYYPEHWPRSLWQDDLRRMKAVGIEVIRIAEFAWNKVEPEDGVFTFVFFDDFMEVVAQEGMMVIFCTPTATPPAWLTHKYPEVLNTKMDGTHFEHGARRHYNYNAKIYREYCTRITHKFAEHYGPHPNVIGWQIDNEINCEIDEFFSEADNQAFRVFLQNKYGTLDLLNQAWGTVFWNQTYTDWMEVAVPRTTVSSAVNPHRVLDYSRFVSASARSFVELQSKILRQFIKENDFITTNGMFSHLDNHKLTRESLDFFTYDSYPNFGYCINGFDSDPKAMRDRNWSRKLTETRSVSRNFGIMEQQSGANGWNTRMEAPTPRPGQLTLWTMQSIAHGADFISYFRWRTCTMGTEIYWHGILDYSGRDNRRLGEVAQVHEKLKKISAVAGSVYKAQVGVLKDYDNIWDAEVDVWHQRVERESEKALFEASQLSHTPMDYVYLDQEISIEDLLCYRVLFYPHATIMTEERRDLLALYVEKGGILVFGCRSGYKDMTGQCTMAKLPGLIADLTGADVPEYSFVAPDSEPVMIQWEDKRFAAGSFTDFVAAIGDKAHLIAEQVTGDYPGTGSLVKNVYGAGAAYYYGTSFTTEAAMIFLERLDVISPYSSILTLPKSCELAVREKDRHQYLFVLNYKKEAVSLNLKEPMLNLYTGEVVRGTVTIEKYGTLVLDRTIK